MSTAKDRKPSAKEQSTLKREAKSYAMSAITFGMADFGDTGRRLKNIVGTFRKKKGGHRVETFSEAAARHQLTEQQIVDRMREVKTTADLIAMLAALALAILVISVLARWPFTVISLLALGCTWSVSQMIVWRFRYDQIRYRELFGFKDWLLGRRTGEFK